MYMSRTRLRIRTFIMGFIMIAQGIATILTLGHYFGWDTTFVFWDTKRWLERRIARTTNEIKKIKNNT